MTNRMNGALRLGLAGSALGSLTSFAFVPVATAQWLSPWRFTPPPGEIERGLEARGYVLTAPLMRRPGVYLADVSVGPAGYQRLVIDARNGQILERFAAPDRMWGPALAARDGEFGQPPPGVLGSRPRGEFSGAPEVAPPAKSAYEGPGNMDIPATISPYGFGEAPARTKPKPKAASTERKAPAPRAPSLNPPLPPPAPREAVKTDGSGSPAPAAPGSSAEAGDKPKVSIVPPALFE